MALDSVEFSDKVSDEELASNFADIVTQMALDVSYPFCSHYALSSFCSFFCFLGSSDSPFCLASESMLTKKRIKGFSIFIIWHYRVKKNLTRVTLTTMFG